ncbi:hypothetical protein AAC387_Pa03g4659 [Persea americana]
MGTMSEISNSVSVSNPLGLGLGLGRDGSAVVVVGGPNFSSSTPSKGGFTGNNNNDCDDHRWPPGFRFHPTDEELVLYYLKRKICRGRFKLSMIGDVDVYKCDPWELPGKSLLQTGDKQWYFFSPRDRKYPNGVRSNRGTKCGYWKTTGKDRNISRNARTVGLKKTLVFYRGRAPKGERTDWVMHEYTIAKEELHNCHTAQDSYALYKIYQKSGPGPKNGEQYGAPFREEEWLDDDPFHDRLGNPTSADYLFPLPEVTDGFSPGLSLHDVPLPEVTDGFSPGLSLHFREKEWLDDDPFHDRLGNPTSADNLFPLPEVTDGFSPGLSLHDVPLPEVTDGFSPGLSLHDVEEVWGIMADDSQVNQQRDNSLSYASEADGKEGIQSTVVRSLLGEPISAGTSEIWQPHEWVYQQTSFQIAQPVGSLLQPSDVSEVRSSPHPLEEEPHAAEGDFMELSDLMDPELVISSLGRGSISMSNPFLDQDGLDDFDFYFDAPMHLPEEIVPPEGTALQPYLDSFSASVASQLWTHEHEYSVFSTAESSQVILAPSASGVVQDSSNSVNINEHARNRGSYTGDPPVPWFTSAINSLLESVPTNPASASENALISRAFERMSSFGAVRIGTREAGVAADTTRREGRNGSFLFLSFLGALWAILWVLMIGTMVKVFKVIVGRFAAS